MKSEIVIGYDQLSAEVLQAIADGRKIVAIKLLREQTGLGLANAKVIVDRVAAKRAPAHGIPALQEESNSRRTAVMLVALCLAACVYFFSTT